MAITFAEAAAVTKEAKDLFSRVAHVVAIGVTKVKKDFALKVNLAEEPLPEVAAEFPKMLHGIPIVVDVTGIPMAGSGRPF